MAGRLFWVSLGKHKWTLAALCWLVSVGGLSSCNEQQVPQEQHQISSPARAAVASDASPHPQIVRPSTPPPKFRIYKFKDDGISPTSVVVPVTTTDEQLKSLLWFFREKVRSQEFKSIGLRSARDGILAVYRGEKCANEQFIDTAGPCGDGEHDDAYYQWGIEADSRKDEGGIRVKGDEIIVFGYKDGWQVDGTSKELH
ncbi:MAG: hypothetical protein WCC04_01975 [Terriglobales bacterium]